MKIIYPALFLFLLCFTQNTDAQGCSDAGFCTINSLKANALDGNQSNKSNQLSFGISAGAADNDVSIFGSHISYKNQVNKDFGFDLKLTFLSQSSSLTNSSGLSDLYASATFNASENAQFTAGLKIPLNDGNKKLNNLSLPMDFQNSLGTTDLILGFSTSIEKLQLTAAIQQPISQNENAFLSTNYPVNSAFRQFQSTNMYERKGDVLLRISYPFVEKEKWKITPSLLPIYHLANDEFTDMSNVKREIAGSNGLTLNGNIFVEHAINKTNKIELGFGAPFVVRTARPDGLTREFIVSLDYKIMF